MNGFYIRIPDWAFDELRSGKINSKMFLVLCWMYKRADWKTGLVRKVSAKRIREEMWGDEVEDKRPTVRTIQEYLWRFRECEYWKSSHVPGQRQTYIIALNNYIAVKIDKDGTQTEELLRPTETKDWHDLPKNRRADNDESDCAGASGDASADISGDASAHTTLCSTLCTTASQHSDKQEREGESEQAATPPPLPKVPTLPPSAVPASPENRGALPHTPEGEPVSSPVYQTPVSVIVAALDSGADDEDFDATQLYWMLNPVAGNGTQAVLEGIARTRKLIDLLDNLNVDAVNLLEWNRAHKPDKLRIKSLARFEKAINGKDGECALVNDYLTHNFNTCKICRETNIRSNHEVRQIKRDLERKAEERRRAAELRSEIEARFREMKKSGQRGMSVKKEGCRRDFLILDKPEGKAVLRVTNPEFWDEKNSHVDWTAMLDYFVKPQNLDVLQKKLGWPDLRPAGFEVTEEELA